MSGTKLSSLKKEDLLSQWQKEQKKKNYYNANFFTKRSNIEDPWAIQRHETNLLKETIPALKSMEFDFSARRRNNRDTNQTIANKKMMTAHKLFHKK